MTIREINGKFRCIEKYKDESGTWRSVTVTIDKNTPQKRKEASRQLEAIIAEKTLPKTEITLSRLVEAYISYEQTTCKKNTWIRNEVTLNYLVKLIGDYPISDLTAGFIRSQLMEHTTKPCTLNEYFRRLKSMFRWAYKNDYIRDTRIPDKLDNFADDHKKRIEDKYLEREELKTVIAAASPFYASVIEFMALSGLRIGEVVALLDDDVTNVISVNKTYSPRANETTTPKTAESNREVHIQPELAAVIARIRTSSREYKLRDCEHYQNFIINPLGRPLSYDKFNRVFGDLTEKTIGRRLTTHALRHTHASLLAESGVPLETISRRLGHSDSGITREIYLHVTKRMKEKDAQFMDAVNILN